MSYLEQLKAAVSGNAHPGELTKPTEAHSVSSVSTQRERFSEINRQHIAVEREPTDVPAKIVGSASAVDAGTVVRRERVLAILAANRGFWYAVLTDSDAEPDAVVVHIGIRGVGSGEIMIAKDNYDGLALLALLERYADSESVIH